MCAGGVCFALVGKHALVHSADKGEKIVRSARPVLGIALPNVFHARFFGKNGHQLRAFGIDGDLQNFVFNAMYHSRSLCSARSSSARLIEKYYITKSRACKELRRFFAL